MRKPLFESLLRETALKIKENPNELVMDVVFEVVNFTDKVPDIDAFLLEDPTLGIEDASGGHNCINYPDDLTTENIVITNLQERVAAHFE